jgi:hypothetical protein
MSDGCQKLKNKGGEVLISFFTDFPLGGKSMPFAPIFCCLYVNLMLYSLVCFVYLGFLVCPRK